MRKIILAFIALFALMGAYAQTITNITRTAPIHTINEKSIVQDTLGNLIPYDTWKPLLVSGEYTLRSRHLINTEADESTVYTLVKATEQQKTNRLKAVSAMVKDNQARLVNSPRILTKPAESTFFTTGETLKPFKVKDIKGTKIEAKDWAGKTVVLNFWFIGCPPCRAEIPELNKLAEKYANNPNVVFIAIALDQSYEIKDFIKTTPYNYHLIPDGRYEAGKFNINLYPTNVVVDKEGKVRYHTVGTPRNNIEWIDKTIDESEKAKTGL